MADSVPGSSLPEGKQLPEIPEGRVSIEVHGAESPADRALPVDDSDASALKFVKIALGALCTIAALVGVLILVLGNTEGTHILCYNSSATILCYE